MMAEKARGCSVDAIRFGNACSFGVADFLLLNQELTITESLVESLDPN